MQQEADFAPHQPKSRPSGMVAPVALVCRILAATALIAMMTITVGDVIARSVFGLSSEVSEEYGGYLLVAITFLSIPVAAAQGGFHQVELIRKHLSERLRLLLQIAFTAAALGACLVVAWNLTNFEIFSLRSGDVSQSSLQTPLWIPQLAIPIGFLLFCWVLLNELARQIASLLREFRSRPDERSR